MRTYPNFLAFFAIVAVFYGCSRGPVSYKQDGNQVFIYPADSKPAKIVRLTVISDKIIRVAATATDSFPKIPSLMVLPQPNTKLNYDIVDADDFITILTKFLQVKVALNTGEVSFLDTLGRPILMEKVGGGKEFLASGRKGLFKIKQSFESPDDDAIYGLGSHQNRQISYKGEDVDLAQHNLGTAVPFVYSSKNYGLLWDNYSISRFGDDDQHQAKQKSLTFSSPGAANIDYYFIAGSNADDVISGYRHLTGKAHILPKWAMGFWQSRGLGEQSYNAYSLVNAKKVYEGQRNSSPGKRVFILTESAFGGQQRYAAASWTGKVNPTWDDLQDKIYSGINFSLSGVPYWTTDIGGYASEKKFTRDERVDINEWRELNTRWFQFSAFCPLFCALDQYPYREISSISSKDHPAYKSMLFYSKLRYRLMPYLYSLAGDCYWKDYTMARGLMMDFAHDPKVMNIGDQFMLGPNLMVSPVYEYHATNRKIYLPTANGWFDFYTGQFYKGGQVIQADAPYERIPLYIREGSILPLAPEMQFSGEKPADPVTLYVFGGRDATFSLYEDESTNYNYESGAWTRVPFIYEEESKTLTIGAREGHYKDMMEGRSFQIIWVKTDHPAGASYMTQTPQVIRYSGSEITINLK